MEHATPTSPWHPTSAAEIDVFISHSAPIAALVRKKILIPSFDVLAVVGVVAQHRWNHPGGVVCEDEGPIPILKRSKTLIIWCDRPSPVPIATFSSFAE
jgi:hypothetical protein